LPLAKTEKPGFHSGAHDATRQEIFTALLQRAATDAKEKPALFIVLV